MFDQAAPAPDQGFRDAPSGEGCGQEHVFQRFQLGEKLEVLKDETDMLPAPAISFVFGQRAGYGRAPAYGSPVRKWMPVFVILFLVLAGVPRLMAVWGWFRRLACVFLMRRVCH